MRLEPEKLKAEFPVFEEHPELAYLDNAATSQKPGRVLDRIEEFYRKSNANVGRGVYDLAESATEAFESSREELAGFVGASPEETVFVRGCTEGMNLVASCVERDGKVAVPESAHHSEMLPWRKNFGEDKVEYIPVEQGEIDIKAAEEMIDESFSVVSVSHVSNVYGTEAPVEQLVEIAHRNGALLVLDAAQSMPHREVDLKRLGVDFATFSAHKMCGPTGVGVLFGRAELLDDMVPYQVGGGMVRSVKKDSVQYGEPPGRFEAGTPDVAGAVGAAEAARFLDEIGRESIQEHERTLCRRTIEELKDVEGVEVLSPEGSTLVSFRTEWAHPHDVAEMFNQEDIAVRAGNHCAQPGMESEGISSGTVRISPYLYNTKRDVQRAVEAVETAREVFQ